MSSFVAIDFETANERRGSPCAVGYAVAQHGEIIDAGAFLIRPPEFRFDGFNVSLHGIRPEMCEGAPEWPEALSRIVEIVDGRLAVAHSAGFDCGVIRDACDATATPWPELRVACTRMIAKSVWPELPSYSLPDVVQVAGCRAFNHHDASEDAAAAAGIALAAIRLRSLADIDALLASIPIVPSVLTIGSYTPNSRPGDKRLPRTPSDAAQIDPDHPLYGKRVVFTGGLMSMPRKMAQQAVLDVGGRPATSVSQKVDIVVVGGEFHGLSRGHEHSAKLDEALRLRAEGIPLELFDEFDFLAMLRGGA